MMDFHDCDCACMACDVRRERRAHPPETEVTRLKRELAEAIQSAHNLETHGLIKYVAVCKERDAALAEAKAAREALQRAEGHMLMLIDERDEARAKNERTFQALCAAQDSHGDTMRQRDEARSVVDEAYGHQDHNDCGEVLAKALKKWWML